jgi:hypothetical protein
MQLACWRYLPLRMIGVVPGARQPLSTRGPAGTPGHEDDVGSICLTWAELVELEPQLQTLLWRAREAGACCSTFTDVDRVFGPVRNELTTLVGFSGQHHRHPVLGSTQAYQVAYSKLYDAVAGLLPSRVGRTKEGFERQPARGNTLARRAG